MVAEAFQKLLEPEYEIVGIVNDGEALLTAAQELTPDIILLDVGMPLLNGLEAGEQLRKQRKTLKIIYLTMNQDRAIAADAFKRGASGYLLKSCASTELLTAIKAVMRGRFYISPVIARDIRDLRAEFEGRSGMPGKLTDRQREVLQLLAEGNSMKEVASKLDLTPRTVAFHKYRIMEVLHLRNSAELVQYAIREHIIIPRA
jgi:DNA-binding NarL/FixJ family response regulator